MRGVNPIAYNIFIRYRDLVYEIPELRPEDFGALKQVLKGYGMDLNECADDLSKYVYIGQPYEPWASHRIARFHTGSNFHSGSVKTNQ